MQILKPCVQSADNQKRDETQSALWEMWHDLLCSRFSLCLFPACLGLCQLSFQSGGGIMMLTPAFMVVNVCVCNKDWLVPWCFMNRTVPCWHGPYLSCFGKHVLTLALGDLMMENNTNGIKKNNNKRCYHTTIHFEYGIVPHCQQGFLAISVFILLYVSKEKCSNVYVTSDSSINNVYNLNASCHFWCCIRIYLSFPLWYLPSRVLSCVVKEYLISLNAIQKNLLSNKKKKFFLHHILYCSSVSFVSGFSTAV